MFSFDLRVAYRKLKPIFNVVYNHSVLKKPILLTHESWFPSMDNNNNNYYVKSLRFLSDTLTHEILSTMRHNKL